MARESALDAIKGGLEGILGRPARLHEAAFLDSTLADLLASDSAGHGFVIRWLDGAESESALLDCLGAYARLRSWSLHPSRPQDLFSTWRSVELVLITSSPTPELPLIASTLNFPVRVVRAHPLWSEKGALSGCYFEILFNSTEKPGTAREAAGASETVDVSSDGAAEPRDVIPEALDWGRSCPDLTVRTSAGSDDDLIEDRAPPTGSDWNSDREELLPSLSDEEAASFRLLEKALAS